MTQHTPRMSIFPLIDIKHILKEKPQTKSPAMNAGNSKEDIKKYAIKTEKTPQSTQVKN